jgi:hypothetical protein
MCPDLYCVAAGGGGGLGTVKGGFAAAAVDLITFLLVHTAWLEYDCHTDGEQGRGLHCLR